MFKDNSIKECCFCGERISGKLCPDHRKKEDRKADIIKQLEIEKERGGEVSDRLFKFDRKALLKEYNL